jgi:hypothetical protein
MNTSQLHTERAHAASLNTPLVDVTGREFHAKHARWNVAGPALCELHADGRVRTVGALEKYTSLICAHRVVGTL